jgi:hypothetical protein
MMDRANLMEKFLTQLIDSSPEAVADLQISFRTGRAVAGAVRKIKDYPGLFECLAVAQKPGNQMVMVKMYFHAEDIETVNLAMEEQKIAVPERGGIVIPGRH